MNRLLFVAVIAMLLSACGGGGGSSKATAPAMQQPVAPPVTITSGGLRVGVVGTTYSDALTASGGTAPYTFTVQGSLPSGISMSTAGVFSGTPTQTANASLTFTATDAAARTATKTLSLVVTQPGTVRNDSLADASPVACCGTIRASLSPYSKASGVVAADNDYYRITAAAADRISVDAVAIGTEIDTDTMIEILDTSGARMNVCRNPGAASTAPLNQPCFNDDINPGVVRGSHLDVQVPANGVFIVRVLDWGGRARPEMTYELRMVKLP